MLGRFSIRSKLLAIMVLTTCTALLMAGLAIVAYDFVTFKRQRLDDLSTQAEMLGEISSAALNFDDAKAAQEYLSALSARPNVGSAVIYDARGRVFAAFQRHPSPAFHPPRAEAEGYRIEGDDLLLFRPIRLGAEVVGTVHLRSSLELRARLLGYASIVLSMLVGSLMVAVLLSAQLQNLISKPLLEIAKVAHSVVEHQDYSPRVIKHSEDEVGVLVDAFNQMLTRIQEREAALHQTNLALQAETTEHRTAREEISALNQNLERRVFERTAELQAVNKELESFSYSVSHDLRAPLRSIDGFSMILEKNYGEQFDEQGRNYLNRVRAATQRMGHLIDDLLKLSRSVRSEMLKRTVNLSDISNQILRELRDSTPERRATVTVEPGMTAHADAELIRTVLENLIGNAWKFTGKNEETLIDIGQKGEGDASAFFVRDNGAGFDMKYAEKLFGAFQRLHRVSEFEGTGVGLANVQRIIHRHGGRIWAEAAPGLGATFYFTLPT